MTFVSRCSQSFHLNSFDSIDIVLALTCMAATEQATPCKELHLWDTALPWHPAGPPVFIKSREQNARKNAQHGYKKHRRRPKASFASFKKSRHIKLKMVTAKTGKNAKGAKGVKTANAATSTANAATSTGSSAIEASVLTRDQVERILENERLLAAYRAGEQLTDDQQVRVDRMIARIMAHVPETPRSSPTKSPRKRFRDGQLPDEDRCTFVHRNNGRCHFARTFAADGTKRDFCGFHPVHPRIAKLSDDERCVFVIRKPHGERRCTGHRQAVNGVKIDFCQFHKSKAPLPDHDSDTDIDQ